MEGHVALVAAPEVGERPLGREVRLGEQDAVRVAPLHLRPDPPQHRVGLGQVLAVGAVALDQVRHRVEAEAVHAVVHPETEDALHLLQHAGVVEVEVGLVGEEAVPVVGARDRIPGPVGRLRLREVDARLGEFLPGVAPDVEVAFGAAGRRVAGRAGTRGAGRRCG